MRVEHGQFRVAHLLVVNEHDPPHERREPDGRVLVRVILSDNYRVRDRKKPAELKKKKDIIMSNAQTIRRVRLVAWVN